MPNFTLSINIVWLSSKFEPSKNIDNEVNLLILYIKSVIHTNTWNRMVWFIFLIIKVQNG